MERKVEISHRTIFFITGFLLSLWLLFQIRDVILLLFVAIIFTAALSPIVEQLTKWRIPKGLAIGLLYISILSVVIGLISIIIVPLTNQTENLVTTLPQIIQSRLPALGIDPQILQNQLASLTGNVFSVSITLFSNVVALISLAVLSFYMIIDRDRLYHLIVQMLPGKKQQSEQLINKIESKLGAWLRGQLLLSLIIGILSYVLLIILRIPYALPLAIIAGFMEVVPVIGPIISAIPAILVALFISPTVALIVALGYFAIQQAENHFIVPQVMNRAVGLNPLIVIIAIAIGGQLLGIAGALLAVPITVVGQILAEELLGVNLDGYTKKPEPEVKKAE